MAQAVTIPANDLKRPFELHADAYEQKALEVLRSGWYILGKEVSAFEQAFAAYLGAHCCVGLASGLDSLWMAFRLRERIHRLRDGHHHQRRLACVRRAG